MLKQEKHYLANNLRLISVIMSVYNEEPQWLGEAIDSILHQSYAHLEFIIIIDNPNNTVLRDMIQKFAQKDARIQYYINDENKGLIYSLNRALTYCKGEYIARMDADDISYPQRLEKQLEYLNKANLDLIGSNVRLFSGDRDVFFTTNKLTTHKYLYKMLAQGTIGIVHPTFFGRKKVFDTLEGYKNAYHAEDQDFLARTFCHGFKVGNIKEVLLDCRYSNESVTKTNAIYVTKVSAYITKVFQQCIKRNRYEYDESYYHNLNISQKDKDAFNHKKIVMDEARKAWYARNYFHFSIKLIQAIFYSKSTLKNIKNNFLLNYFKWREEKALMRMKSDLV